MLSTKSKKAKRITIVISVFSADYNRMIINIQLRLLVSLFKIRFIVSRLLHSALVSRLVVITTVCISPEFLTVWDCHQFVCLPWTM